MSPRRVLLALVVVLGLALAGTAQQRDLRDQFGTRSLAAAKQINQAIQLSGAKKHKEALTAVEGAIKNDPQCQMARYWKGIILGNLGEITKSIAAYKKCLSDDVRRSQNISASAAMNLALVNAKLEEYEESNRWFTRAILEDYNNAAKQRGRAYRNLSVTMTRQGKHLTAALALLFALRDKVPGVTEKMVATAYVKGHEQEVANLLYFPDETPKIEKRSQPNKLTLLDLKADVAEEIVDLQADPQGRYMVALPKNAAHYYLIATANKAAVTKIAVKGAPVCACLAGGFLYTVGANPGRIDQIGVETGKVVKTYPLKSFLPRSLAVFPARGVAYFASSDYVYGMNLNSGTVFKSEIAGQAVVGHPKQQFVYSMLRDTDTRWIQTTLIKGVAVPGGLLVASWRDNAASNGSAIRISPDGNWVAVVGGGGWRPTVKPPGATGYGVAVFSAHDPDHLQGFFKTDAYPRGVGFNPVTGQLVAIRDADAKVYHLADSKTCDTYLGQFNGVCAWSGNGKYLVAAQKTKGISVWENTLSAQETKLAGTWWKSLVVKVSTAPAATFKVVEALKTFAVKSPSRKEVSAALARAVKEGRTDRAARWQEYQPYLKDDAMRKTIGAAIQNVNQKGDFGIAIFKIKKALKTYPDSPPLKFFLAEALRLGDQAKESEEFYLAALQGDAGRTELSRVSLNRLAALLAARDQALSALDCLAASLSLDKANPATLAQTIELLKKNKFDAEVKVLTRLAEGLPVSTGSPAGELPKLAKPGSESKKYTAAEIYKLAVPSVVLIKTERASGSGVCVGKAGFILTNHHVIADGGDIYVTPFTFKDKALARLDKVKATVVYQSEKEDVAVLKLEKVPKQLVPLAVGAATPGAGARVYAIGSPGLGKDILEQSISEGIVSAAKRVLDEQTYVQHTAAVNPGNSGGPLIDDKGRIVGIVTLKAKLDKVSFAIPVETIRKIFKSP
jgi:S1-C subfamily serine protease/Tfp pilus assembly protein PilF